VKAISSRDNPRFKRLRKWATQHRARREDSVILLDGLHLIEALLAAGGTLDEVAVSHGGAQRPEIAGWLSGRPGLDVLQFPDALFAEFAATETPSGIVAVARKPVAAAVPAGDADCVLLDGVQDPGNVGTLLRTAAAAGIRQILLAPGCADPWAPKTLRAGQGAQFLLDIREGVDLAAFLEGYAGQGVVTRLDAPATLWETPLDGPLAWVFGAEGQGVSAPVATTARLSVRIPMPGGTESLNVAAAAAICLFEKVRRAQPVR
jgi:TrmH family RNA methyltransferase